MVKKIFILLGVLLTLSACAPPKDGSATDPGLEPTTELIQSTTVTHTPIPSQTPQPTIPPTPTAIDPILASQGFDLASFRADQTSDSTVQLTFQYRLGDDIAPERVVILWLIPERCQTNGSIPSYFPDSQQGEGRLILSLTGWGECDLDKVTFSIYQLDRDQYLYQEEINLPVSLRNDQPPVNQVSVSLGDYSFIPTGDMTGEFFFSYEIDEQFSPSQLLFAFFSPLECQSNGVGGVLFDNSGNTTITLQAIELPCELSEFEIATLNAEDHTVLQRQKVIFPFAFGQP